jgi:hypothetical protein
MPSQFSYIDLQVKMRSRRGCFLSEHAGIVPCAGSRRLAHVLDLVP